MKLTEIRCDGVDCNNVCQNTNLRLGLLEYYSDCLAASDYTE